MDRPSLSPFELLDQIEREFGMKMAPVLWPIGDGERFKVRMLTQMCRVISLFQVAGESRDDACLEYTYFLGADYPTSNMAGRLSYV